MPNLRLTSINCLPPNKISIFIICYVLTFISACSQPNGKNYFPLVNGSKWEYAGQSSSPDGKQISFRARARVDGETLINGQRYFKHITSSDLSGTPEVGKEREYVRYYRIADDGIYYRLGNNPEGPELVEIPLPIPVGTKWLSGPVEVQAERAGTIIVEGRQYRDCLKITYRQQATSASLENYLAPGVGIVKARDVDEAEPKTTVELTLKKYEP